MRQPVAGTESIDAGMFEKATDDRFDLDRIGKAGHAGAQAADAAHDELDLHSGPARAVKGINDLGIDKRVAFAPDSRRAALSRMADFFLDIVEKLGLQRNRRNR